MLKAPTLQRALRPSLTPALAAAAAALAAVALLRPQPAEATDAARFAQPTSIATVDIKDVIDQLDQRDAMERELGQFLADRQALLDELSAQIEEAAADGEILPEGSPERAEAARRVRELQALGQTRQRFLEQEIDRQRSKMWLTLLREVDEAVDEIAQRDAWEIVIVDDTGLGLPEETAPEQESLGALFRRRVLHAADRVDITGDVVVYMNNRFNSGGR